MTVVADTGPINYLVLIGQIDLLPKLYDAIAVPDSVWDELDQPETPAAVRAWLRERPNWIQVLAPTGVADSRLEGLDRGERDAILLAQDLRADEVIIDDMRGRREAQRRGLTVTGTLGVLDTAARMGLVDLRAAIEQLRGTSFHMSEALLARILTER